MSYQGVKLTKFFLVGGALALLLLGVYLYALQHESLADFIKNPMVSFIGWLVSLVAGFIAIFEFCSYKEMKNKYESLRIEFNKRCTDVSGSATYIENNEGGVSIRHGAGDE